MKIPETALPVKSLENFSCTSHPDASVPKNFNDRKDVHGSTVICETFRNPNEMHNKLLFNDNEEGTLLSNIYLDKCESVTG